MPKNITFSLISTCRSDQRYSGAVLSHCNFVITLQWALQTASSFTVSVVISLSGSSQGLFETSPLSSGCTPSWRPFLFLCRGNRNHYVSVLIFSTPNI